MSSRNDLDEKGARDYIILGDQFAEKGEFYPALGAYLSGWMLNASGTVSYFDVADRLINLGQEQESANKDSEAILAYRLVRALDDNIYSASRAYAYFNEGWIHLSRGEKEYGLSLMEKGWDLDPGNQGFGMIIGEEYLRNKDFEAGVEILYKALQIDDFSENAQEIVRAIAFGHHMLGNTEDAVDVLKRYVEINADNDSGVIEDFDEDMDSLDDAMSLYFDKNIIIKLYLWYAQKSGVNQYIDAIKYVLSEIENIINDDVFESELWRELNSELIDIYTTQKIQLLDVLVKSDQKDQALSILEQLIVMYPNDQDMLIGKGLILFDLAKHSEVIDYIDSLDISIVQANPKLSKLREKARESLKI